jgi:hypothetical protein
MMIVAIDLSVPGPIMIAALAAMAGMTSDRAPNDKSKPSGRFERNARMLMKDAGAERQDSCANPHRALLTGAARVQKMRAYARGQYADQEPEGDDARVMIMQGTSDHPEHTDSLDLKGYHRSEGLSDG